ncbi:MAG: MFS transporter [Longimicrobiales bacterium]|nr:MFS transporter [Longimicrobiales bacterium]
MTAREDPAGARWRILALVSGAELLGMSLWFTASAVSPQLAEQWELTASQAGWLTTMVQIGFVAGTAVAAGLNLADILPDRPYFAGSALLGALANLGIIVVPDYEGAVVLRFFTGFFLAGVYPPAMKMIATWFRSGRGLAIGTIVGALTVGKATPYLVHAFAEASVVLVVATASAGAGLAALLVLIGYRDGPFPFQRRPFSWKLVGTVLRDRPTRLAIYGYLGHMWELYAMWTLIAAYYVQVFRSAGAARPGTLGDVAGFLAIAAGGVGSVAAGRWADRWGRERVASGAMVVSGACALIAGWLVGASPWVVVPLGLVWGFAIVADSAQFSALVTEVAPAHAVGTALTLQTSLGFALTALSIALTVGVVAAWGWGPAFALLAAGPAFGIWSMRRLAVLRHAAR